ncbi:DUF3570 domain-containing protein [Nitrosomonas supralitoralis]|uniref:DUF3570 domain-containing protein n=1 Tax=Nitrosomonas supralitoralis TaxID=2116706 RepID=A0A2P7NXE8_9PROT|nr:DUF3570 domain-containing protein [Nitrosomonas supralitoralis]PSJ18129.1 hypothetical protein C7H79_04545 [Nitrosomonas supralitoralis]
MQRNSKPRRQRGCQPIPLPEITSSVKPRNTLQALTSAAMVLPGLLLSPGHAAGQDRVNFQYSRYQEGERNLFGAPNNLKPISADVLHGSGVFSFTDRFKFTFGYTQDTWSGATPVTTTPLATDGGNRPYTVNGVVVGASPLANSQVLLDHDLNPIGRDPITKQLVGGIDTRSVLVMSSASPETRRQANFGLSYEWNEAAMNVGGGFSRERDYQSSFGNIGGRLDFNQKLTSVKFGGGYTSSEIGAILDHDSSPYITKQAYAQQIVRRDGSEILRGDRKDWVANVGLTQVLTKNALIDANVGYTHSSGFLENPYKATSIIFIDPAQLNNSLISGDVRAFIEQRPNIRNQIALNAKYIQYISPFNAAMHLGYRLSVDDWGVNTHTFDASWVQPIGGGWTLTPRIRYYSQDSASFYRPYLFSQQAFSKQEIDSLGRKVWVDQNNLTKQYFGETQFDLVDQNGNAVDFSVNAAPKMTSYDSGKLPDHFSSDHRLAGFGALSGGVILSKTLGKGVALEAGFEYYTRASSMQIGGGGSNSFADFDYYVANAAIKFDIEPATLPPMGTSGGSSESHSHATSHQHHKIPPAGIMFGHMLDKAGDFMAGYRFMYNWTGGNMMHGTQTVNDQTIVDQGCSDIGLCRFVPTFMNMRMHMVDLMYAPTHWLNVMLMPTFMDMDMNLRRLDGAPPPRPGVHEHTGAAGHETGAVGDTYFSSMIKLLDIPGHRVHANLGFSAPTGKVDIELRRIAKIDGGLIHFGMQLGSGTWDFTPSLTYAGEYNRWSWGTQFSGIKRLEEQNKSGYRLGDQFQATTWGGYDLKHWLTATIRGAYTWQDAIHRDFNKFNARIGPMDFPSNYGGQFFDMGFGVNVRILGGRFAGNQLGLEWLQPIRSDFNGYQLDRQGMLSATWSYEF